LVIFKDTLRVYQLGVHLVTEEESAASLILNPCLSGLRLVDPLWLELRLYYHLLLPILRLLDLLTLMLRGVEDELSVRRCKCLLRGGLRVWTILLKWHLDEFRSNKCIDDRISAVCPAGVLFLRIIAKGNALVLISNVVKLLGESGVVGNLLLHIQMMRAQVVIK
jgi:hypothetical protein